MNRLQHETSPYLLQHAANPVDWWAWGPAALAHAREVNKPILVSIGYSTCHWCHVMERESFENPVVAKIMNEHFVSIKVDREERPDVDAVYMEACQAISGSGGWPLNAFLLPDGRPFYAGTYFPPQSAHNRPGWSDLLRNIATIWREKQDELVEQAERLTRGIAGNNELFISASDEPVTFGAKRVEAMIGRLKQGYDVERGGFGGAPKFPMSQALELLLDHAILNEDESALHRVDHALDAMIGGGIYDQLRGGFARYTVDANWRVPHFEKMLYDNALLLRLLARRHLYAPAPRYATIIRETIGWLRAEMLAPAGYFYAALDADSEGVEGKFYVWDYDELEERLSTAELSLLTEYFGVTPAGSWAEESTNILYRAETLPPEEEERWEALRQKLLTHRDHRIRPGRDEKIILQWNALLISGLAHCARALPGEGIDELALTAIAALKAHLRDEDGQWHRNYTAGQRGVPAFLDDLTALYVAQLDLYDLTFEVDYLLAALDGERVIQDRFGGAAGGLCFLAPNSAAELPTATVPLYDNALPSGNGQYLHLLRRLTSYTGEPSYRRRAEAVFAGLAASVGKYPSSFANLARLGLLLSRPARELIISGGLTSEVAKQVRGRYRPDLTVVVAPPTNVPSFPILEGRTGQKEPRFYLCENQSCRLPVSSLNELSL